MTTSSADALTSRELAHLLRAHKEELIRKWTRRVLDDPSIPEAKRLTEPDLLDHIPKLVDHIALWLEGAEQGDASGLMISATGQIHGQHRLLDKYRLTEAISELSHFRTAVLDLCTERGVTLELEAARRLHAAIDQSMIGGSDAMERAVVAHFRQQTAFRERFMGILGHELREPLQAITAFVALVLKREQEESQYKLMGRIAATADRMRRMIEDLLDVTRTRLGGGLPIELEPGDLCAIVQQVIGEAELARPNRTVQLEVQGDARGIWDLDRIAQVASNLICNALDYSPYDLPVRVTLRGEQTHVLLIVNNRGAPIAPAVMRQLFEPFARVRQSERPSHGHGLGLGLFIARQIVEAHSGDIDVASTAEEGTTFTVRVPRRANGAGRSAGGTSMAA